MSIPQDKRASLVDDFAGGSRISVPADTGFNLHESQRTSAGHGRAESSADASGKARCVAASEGEGSAEAQFQLGHVLDNRGSGPLEVTVRFDLDYQCRVQSDADNTSKPADQLGLRVYVRDSNQRILRNLTVAQVLPFTGPKQWTGRQTPTFDVTMEPGLAYYLVLAGRASVTGTADSPTQAEIDIKSFSIELTPHQ